MSDDWAVVEEALKQTPFQIRDRVKDRDALAALARLREREAQFGERIAYLESDAALVVAEARVARLEEALREIIADGGSYKRAWMIARRALAHEEEA